MRNRVAFTFKTQITMYTLFLFWNADKARGAGESEEVKQIVQEGPISISLN